MTLSLHDIIDAVLLGGVEGLTEFLPVSSTGHLIVVADLLGFDGNVSKIFEVVIQLGAILAVCLVYFQRLWRVVLGLGQRDRAAVRFTVAVLLAFIPSVVLGLALHDFIKEVLFSPSVVAWSMIVGAVAIFAVEKFKPTPRVHAVEEFTPALALKIGLAQCLALIPGVSRSGATIMGALAMGIDRKTAAEFSFFLAIPTMMGATALDLYKGFNGLSLSDVGIIAIGFVAAFISALLVIKWFIGFITRHDFMPFAWYRLVAGVAMLVAIQMGWVGR